MKKIFVAGLIVFVILAPRVLRAGDISPEVLYIHSELQSVLNVLSDNIDRFEHLQKMLEDTGKDNESYDENKNIWMSTILAIGAISSVCEYENSLLTLFLDLRKSRRAHYFEVRSRSLENSIQQITVMREQIQINHALMPPDLADLHLFENLKKNIDSSIDLLKKSKELIRQLKPLESAQK
jgi:ABC-type uncharacterized transport system permease subunit